MKEVLDIVNQGIDAGLMRSETLSLMELADYVTAHVNELPPERVAELVASLVGNMAWSHVMARVDAGEGIKLNEFGEIVRA